jgi:hypothetical protein
MVDRQSRRLGCTAIRMSFGLLALLSARVALAAATVTIDVAATSTHAPAKITLSANFDGEDPVIAYDWDLLDSAPRCRLGRCELDVPIASCRRVEVRVTTDLGETATATRAVCLGDVEGQPPIARLVIEDRGEGPVIIRARFDARTDPVRVRRFWIDDREEEGDLGELVRDGGCHAVDLLIADERGRIGLDRRRICTGVDAPRVWLGAMPASFVPVADTLTVCGDTDHPAALDLVRTQGNLPIRGCEAIAVPASVRREVVRVRDTSGIESTASLIFGAAPSRAAPRLFFAELRNAVTVREPAPVEVDVDLFGGEGPFAITATLASLTAKTTDFERVEETTSSLRLRFDPPATGDYSLELAIVDARGLEARASGLVTVFPAEARPDGGMNVEPSNARSSSVGCTIVDPPASAMLFFELALVAIAIRRRR